MESAVIVTDLVIAGLIASALRRRGLKLGVLDADITGPSIFGVRQPPGGGRERILPPETATGIMSSTSGAVRALGFRWTLGGGMAYLLVRMFGKRGLQLAIYVMFQRLSVLYCMG